MTLLEIEVRLRELADLDERSYDVSWVRRVQIIRESCDALKAERERIEALIPSKAEREFMEAAMEWGANSVKWDTASEPDDRRVLRNEAQEICVRMDRAYRALLTERRKDASL